MITHQLAIERIEPTVDSTDLGQDIHAVTVFFKHPFESPHLSLNSIKAFDEILVFPAVFIPFGFSCIIVLYLRYVYSIHFLPICQALFQDQPPQDEKGRRKPERVPAAFFLVAEDFDAAMA